MILPLEPTSDDEIEISPLAIDGTPEHLGADTRQILFGIDHDPSVEQVIRPFPPETSKPVSH